MAGSRNGVKSQILKQEPRALFMHCYGYALSLSIADSVKLIPLLASTMDKMHKISKMLQYSPNSYLQRRQSPNLSRLCWVSSTIPNPMDCLW